MKAENNTEKGGSVAFSRVMAADDSNKGIVFITGYIGCGSATVAEFSARIDDLIKQGVDSLELVINSPGGNLFEACGIYDLIRNTGLPTTARIYGVAASAATLVACAASQVKISENSRYMVHRAAGAVEGNADEIEAYAADLKKAEEQVIAIYAQKTGKPEEEIQLLLSNEQWMTAEEAVAGGWCDEIIPPKLLENPAQEEPEKEDTDAEVEEPEEEPQASSPAVLRRVMKVLGLDKNQTIEELEVWNGELAAENESLRAENDGLKGIKSTVDQIITSHEREFKARVQQEVIAQMASMGVPVNELPAPSLPKDEQPEAMTNAKLSSMSAKDAMEWIRSHPIESARLADEV